MRSKYFLKFKKKSKLNYLIKKYSLSINHKKFSLINLVHMAIYTSFFLLVVFVPFIAYIPIIPKIVTVTYIPFLVVFSICHLGVYGFLVTGIGFGLSSWISSLIYGFSIKYQLFDVAVLPRFVMALLIFILYKLIKFSLKPSRLKFVFLTFCSTFFNIVLTISYAYFHNYYISKIHTLLPFKIWLWSHLFQILTEIVFNSLLAFSFFYFLLFWREKSKFLLILKY